MMKQKRIIIVYLQSLLVFFLFETCSLTQANALKYDKVLELSPVGYWPVDEGEGQVLRDLSVTQNHGMIYHVPWDKDKSLLDFTGAYQWLQIPANKVYQTNSFSLGGWVYLRSDVQGSGWPNRQGMLLIGNKHWLNGVGVQLCIRQQELVDVVSDGKEDVLGTRLYSFETRRAIGEPSLKLGQWYHIIYTFEPQDQNKMPRTPDLALGDKVSVGTGSLYLDGDLVRKKDDIFYKSAGADIQIGNDAYWWHQMAGKSGSLDGSVRDMVWFDRAIGNDEVVKLYRAAKPVVSPRSADVEKGAAKRSSTDLLRLVQSETASKTERAQAVLDLIELGDSVKRAAPILVEQLKKIVEQDGERMPRIEDILRNALISALLQSGADDVAAQEVLALALAKPVLENADMSQAYLSEVRELFQGGRIMEAYELFRKQPLAKYGERYFTYQEPGNRDYTSAAYYKGTTYKIGTGKAWQGGENVAPQEYQAILARLAKYYPESKDWRPPNYQHLYRVPIAKVNPDGSEEKVYLGGEDFVIDGEDAKMLGWSIFIDEAGYLHLMGGQHNTPNPGNYIPGSWEKMGIPRDRSSGDFPGQMYWVSKKPGDINSFEFVGQKSNPRAIPAIYLNYLVFVQSPKNETYLYGRTDAFGWQCWGMFSYKADKHRWIPVGGDPYDLIESARRHNSDWIKYLHDPIRGGIPNKPSDKQILAWAWQPPFYNFCRDNWGAKFDKTGRMHVRMQISGLDEKGYNHLSSVYAWSQDNGKTFYRADGSEVLLPLTINPAPEHNADLKKDNSKQWLDLWLSLIAYSGYEVIK